MAPPFRVDTENPVEFDERQEIQAGKFGQHERRDHLPTPGVERVELEAYRDHAAHGRQAASLHHRSDSPQSRPTPQTADQQSTSARLTNCGAGFDAGNDDTDGPILEINEDSFADDQCPHARGDLTGVSNDSISVEANLRCQPDKEEPCHG